MPRKVLALFSEFVARLNSLEVTRKKVESCAVKGLLVRRDVEKVYEALYLRAIVEFEGYIEDLFIGMLTKRVLPRSYNAIPRVEFRSDQVAREVVYGGGRYIDWFPYDKTLRLAKAFFRGGRPFTNLDDADKEQIHKLLCIRNAIAHNSHHARRRFITEIIGSTPLLPREKNPAGFLRSPLLSSMTIPQTRYEQYAIEMVALARKMAH